MRAVITQTGATGVALGLYWDARRLVLRARISWLKTRMTQLEGAISTSATDTQADAAGRLADMVLERIKLQLQIDNLTGRL